jgi:arylformamidase
MNKFLDISVSLSENIPIWPGSVGFKIHKTMSIEAGDKANVSCITCDVHVGTHIDAPNHFIADGKAVDELLLKSLIGPAEVVYLPGIKKIAAKDLKNLSISKKTNRLLIRTRNSELWEKKERMFRPDYTALTPDADLTRILYF